MAWPAWIPWRFAWGCLFAHLRQQESAYRIQDWRLQWIWRDARHDTQWHCKPRIQSKDSDSAAGCASEATRAAHADECPASGSAVIFQRAFFSSRSAEYRNEEWSWRSVHHGSKNRSQNRPQRPLSLWQREKI